MPFNLVFVVLRRGLYGSRLHGSPQLNGNVKEFVVAIQQSAAHDDKCNVRIESSRGHGVGARVSPGYHMVDCSFVGIRSHTIASCESRVIHDRLVLS